jgi:curved DNA-binding protein CbpA
MTDYYGLLGVPRNATQREIKRAFMRLAAEHHPDKGGDAGVMASINKAYEVLGNAEKRKLYDAGGDEAVALGNDLDAQAVSRLKKTLHQLIYAQVNMDMDPIMGREYDLLDDLRTGVQESKKSAHKALRTHERVLKKLEKLQHKKKSKKTGAQNFFEEALQEQADGIKHTIFTIKREMEIAERALELIGDLTGTEDKTPPMAVTWGKLFTS